jgi:hypothetical protein
LAALPAACHSLFATEAWHVKVSSELEGLNQRVRAGAPK